VNSGLFAPDHLDPQHHSTISDQARALPNLGFAMILSAATRARVSKAGGKKSQFVQRPYIS